MTGTSAQEGPLPAALYTELQLVSDDELRMLREDLRDEDAYREFIGRWVRMWPERYQRLHDALASGDLAAAQDAVLSLKTSSRMAGAPRLTQMAADLYATLRNSSTKEESILLASIGTCGDETRDRLRREIPRR